MTDSMDGLILLPRLRVENANAISGPLTWGFPAPTAFTGFVHALQRQFGSEDVHLDGVGIICHSFYPQVYRPAGKYSYRFNLARHPMGKDGQPPGTVEEGRAHMEVSLLIGVNGYLDEYEGKEFAEQIHHAAQSMRLAGGSILPGLSNHHRYKPSYIGLSGTLEGDKEVFRKLRRRLLPGFALISRHDVLNEHLAELRQQQPESTSLDALLDLIRLNIEPMGEDPHNPEKILWQASRARPGWLVPLPIGYGAISPLYSPGEVRNARDKTVPFRFVESLYSLGEWRSPHWLNHPQELLWYHRPDPDSGLYLCGHNQPSA